MAKEHSLLDAFVDLADTSDDRYDLVECMHGLALLCVDILDVGQADVVLADEDGVLRFVASSSDGSEPSALYECQIHAGPCLESFRTATAVHHRLERWPALAARAHASGFASTAAYPMRLRHDVIGALNVFSTNAQGVEPDDSKVLQALADVATIGILQERALHDARVRSEQLQAALESRIVIEQAKGMIAESNGVSIDGAFAQLRAYCRNHGARLSDAARAVVNRSLDVSELAERSRREPE